MNVPNISIKQLQAEYILVINLKMNPKMKSFIYGEKKFNPYIDLTQTVTLIKSFSRSSQMYFQWRKNFNCFDKKTSFRDSLKVAAETGQFYVNYRWLGR